ncbi:catalase [Kushneria pakistanensis]|uniref:catalase n=1 Tax=Kushneria pakistanensis TaxID=1508770 RepID=A0ABQ3FC09_9GAMM|nr:catalase [Kushneria pakistanensis]GHC17969.1 catalase [Kushneria pakistanensis]
MTDSAPIRYTTANGAPVPNDDASITAGRNGPLTFDNWRLFEKLAHFNREQIPERVVHARGSAAFGTFRLTRDLSDLTIADFLRGMDTQTPVALRFSTVAGGQDSADNIRDVRGFAVKFYTREGNFDLVGNNTPVFFIREPSKFPDFIHTQKKDPRTNLPSQQNQWEFWANHPQSFHQVTILKSDRGMPYSYRTMHGFGSHTLSLYNDAGQRVWVKWHFKTNQGIRNMTPEEAQALPINHHQADLFSHIEQGDFPSWTVKLQVMTEEQARDYHINPFDLTKIWPHADFPLMEIGQLELNRNPDNYFAEVEQLAFSPSNFVPGVSASPDRVLQSRLWSYADAHRYRLTVNYQQIPVNQPRCPVNNYQRDGFMAGTLRDNGQGGQYSTTNFYPNDRVAQGAPAPDVRVGEPPMPLEADAWVGYYDNTDEDNFSQAGNLYRLFDEGERDRLTSTIAADLTEVDQRVRERIVAQCHAADHDYGERVENRLKALLGE